MTLEQDAHPSQLRRVCSSWRSLRRICTTSAFDWQAFVSTWFVSINGWSFTECDIAYMDLINEAIAELSMDSGNQFLLSSQAIADVRGALEMDVNMEG